MKKKQVTPGGSGFEKCNKVTRRAAFLAEIDWTARWEGLCALA